MARRAFREALIDFYYNSWRLAPANLAWTVVALVVAFLAVVWPPGWLLVPVVAVPFAGISRLAGVIVRGEGASIRDFVDGIRQSWLPALTTGAVASILAVMFTSNVLIGLDSGNPVGWFLSATALYADVGLALFLVAFWPLLTDPWRDGQSLRSRLRLAFIVSVARPARMVVLTVLLGIVLAVSTVLVATLALVGVAYVSLVSARYVLPVADILDGQARLLPRRSTERG